MIFLLWVTEFGLMNPDGSPLTLDLKITDLLLLFLLLFLFLFFAIIIIIIAIIVFIEFIFKARYYLKYRCSELSYQ